MVLVRKVTTFAAASLLSAGSVATADEHSAGLGMFAVAPGFNLGASLAFYNLADVIGADATVYGWNAVSWRSRPTDWRPRGSEQVADAEVDVVEQDLSLQDIVGS